MHIIFRPCAIGFLLLALYGSVAAAEYEPVLERFTITYPQPERIATVVGRGTQVIPLHDARFDPRFDTLTITGVWKNPSDLNFRGASLKFSLLGEDGTEARSVLAEYLPVFHHGRSSSFALLVRVTEREKIAAVKPRISFEVRTYQEESQRNSPRFRGP